MSGHPIMNIVVEKLPKCAASIRVEIPAETVTSERNPILRSYTSKARVPGFRPGKAPLAVIEKRFGKEITDELVGKLINAAFDQALEQESLKVLEWGNPQDVVFHDDGSFSFSSTLTLAPEVQLPEYKGIAVTVPPTAVPDEELDAQLQGLRERFADFTAIEDRGAEMGDFAVIDYTSTVNGQPTEEFLGKPAGYLAGREGFWVRLDEKFFLPGFAAQVVGMNPGETRDITISLPEDFPVAELCNQEMLCTTTLKELKVSILPELDDALAERLAPGKTMDELKTIIRDNMQYERQRNINDAKVNQIVAHFNALADFDLPEELLSQETQTQADAMVERGIKAGMTEEEIQTQQAELFAAAGQQAVSNLRTNFILQEIARAEGITVEDKELINHLAQVAVSRKLVPNKFIKDMSRAGRIPTIRQSMVVGKTLDFLVAQATVTEVSDTTLDD
ncbi:MAG: trigger factor [Verrucomicrobiota bacterium]